MNPVVAYTLGRIGVFAAVAGVLYLIGFRNYALVLLALLISMPLSYLVLRRQRTAFADSVSERLERRRAEKESLRAELRGDASEK
jgi:hypothetical protein